MISNVYLDNDNDGSRWSCPYLLRNVHIHRLGKILPVTNWGPKSPYSTASMILVAAAWGRYPALNGKIGSKNGNCFKAFCLGMYLLLPTCHFWSLFCHTEWGWEVSSLITYATFSIYHITFNPPFQSTRSSILPAFETGFCPFNP